MIEKENKKPDQARAQCESLWDQDKKKKKGEAMDKIPLIIDGVLDIPWAILPSKLDEIMAVLQSKNSGLVFEMVEKNKQSSESQKDINYHVNDDGIAEIIIDGTLSRRMGMIQALSGGTSYSDIQSQVKRAEDDPAIEGLFYDFNSPGGNVDGMFNTADIIFDAKKPSMAFANGLMASAAYIIGSGTNYIVASDRSTEIGSLGVIAVHFDESKKYEKEGVKPTVFSAGKYKKIGNPYESLTKKDSAFIQAKLDYMFTLMTDTVSTHRNISAKNMIEHEVVGGDIFIGEQGINAGLCDEILSRSQAIEKLREMI